MTVANNAAMEIKKWHTHQITGSVIVRVSKKVQRSEFMILGTVVLSTRYSCFIQSANVSDTLPLNKARMCDWKVSTKKNPPKHDEHKSALKLHSPE